jgi:hypothetical protein
MSPELLQRFYNYYEENPAWGALHIVLDDGNISDIDIEFCIDYAIKNNDLEGEELGKLLLTLSQTQRLKLPHRIMEIKNEGFAGL